MRNFIKEGKPEEMEIGNELFLSQGKSADFNN